MDYSDEKGVEAEVRKLWDAGADFEAIVAFMRERGISQTDSFLMLARVTGLDRLRAQKVVFLSKTWADCIEAIIQTQKDFIQAVKQLNEEDPTFKMSFQFEPDPEESEDEPDGGGRAGT